MVFDATFNNISVIKRQMRPYHINQRGYFLLSILIPPPLIHSEHVELESKIEYKVI